MIACICGFARTCVCRQVYTNITRDQLREMFPTPRSKQSGAFATLPSYAAAMQDVRANDRRWQQGRMVLEWAAKQREIARELAR